MKKLAIIYIMLLPITIAAQTDTVDIFILYHQSNAEGKGNNSMVTQGSIYSDYLMDDTFGYLYRKSNLTIEPLTIETSRGSAKDLHGVDVPFAVRYYQDFGRPCYFIKYAVFNTGMAGRWNVHTGDLFDGLFNPTTGYLKSVIENIGLPYRLAGIIGIGGEADAIAEYSSQYYDNFKDFIDSVNILTDTTLHIFNRLHNECTYYEKINRDNVRHAQDRLASENDNCFSFNCDNISLGNDELHFNTLGIYKLGNGMYDTWHNLMMGEEINNFPVPEISFESTAFQGMVYELDASNSYDLDEDVLTYNWILPNEISSSSTTDSIISILPTEDSEEKLYNISLAVSDSKETVTENISIGVYQFRPDAQQLIFNSVEASNHSGANNPTNLIDNNTNTLWKSEGDGEWVIFNIDNKANVTHFELYFNDEDNYQYYFDIFGSNDKENWELILENRTSCGFYPNLHTFAMPESKLSEYYQYFKLVGHMNSADQWNSFSEFKAFGFYADPLSVGSKDNKVKMEDIVSVYPNPAANLVYVSNVSGSLIQVVNILGEVVFEKYSHKNITQIDYEFVPGLYIITIIKDKTIMYSKKLSIK